MSLNYDKVNITAIIKLYKMCLLTDISNSAIRTGTLAIYYMNPHLNMYSIGLLYIYIYLNIYIEREIIFCIEVVLSIYVTNLFVFLRVLGWDTHPVILRFKGNPILHILAHLFG